MLQNLRDMDTRLAAVEVQFHMPKSFPSSSSQCLDQCRKPVRRLEETLSTTATSEAGPDDLARELEPASEVRLAVLERPLVDSRHPSAPGTAHPFVSPGQSEEPERRFAAAIARAAERGRSGASGWDLHEALEAIEANECSDSWRSTSFQGFVIEKLGEMGARLAEAEAVWDECGTSIRRLRTDLEAVTAERDELLAAQDAAADGVCRICRCGLQEGDMVGPGPVEMQLADVQDQLIESKSENSRLVQRLESERSSVHQLQAYVQELTAECSDAHERCSWANSQLQDLQERHAIEQAERSELEQSLDHVYGTTRQLQKQLHDVTKGSEGLMDLDFRCSEANQRVRDATARLQAVEADRDALSQQLQDERRGKQSVLDRLEAAWADSEEAATQAASRLEECSQHATLQQEGLRQTLQEESRQQHTVTEARLDAALAQRCELAAAFEESRSEAAAQLASVRAELDVAATAAADHREKLHVQQQEHRQLQQLLQQHEVLQQELRQKEREGAGIGNACGSSCKSFLAAAASLATPTLPPDHSGAAVVEGCADEAAGPEEASLGLTTSILREAGMDSLAQAELRAMLRERLAQRNEATVERIGMHLHFDEVSSGATRSPGHDAASAFEFARQPPLLPAVAAQGRGEPADITLLANTAAETRSSSSSSRTLVIPSEHRQRGCSPDSGGGEAFSEDRRACSEARMAALARQHDGRMDFREHSSEAARKIDRLRTRFDAVDSERLELREQLRQEEDVAASSRAEYSALAAEFSEAQAANLEAIAARDVALADFEKERERGHLLRAQLQRLAMRHDQALDDQERCMEAVQQVHVSWFKPAVPDEHAEEPLQPTRPRAAGQAKHPVASQRRVMCGMRGSGRPRSSQIRTPSNRSRRTSAAASIKRRAALLWQQEAEEECGDETDWEVGPRGGQNSETIKGALAAQTELLLSYLEGSRLRSGSEPKSARLGMLQHGRGG